MYETNYGRPRHGKLTFFCENVGYLPVWKTSPAQFIDQASVRCQTGALPPFRDASEDFREFVVHGSDQAQNRFEQFNN
jgi:hypothetical protein